MTTTLSPPALASPPAATAPRVAKGPIDRRLLRHARASRAGIAVLALIGIGQAAATITIAVALTWIVAGTGFLTGSVGGPPGTGFSWIGFSRIGESTAGAGTTGSAGGPAWGWAVGLLAGAFAVRGLLAWAEQVVAQRTAALVTDELRQSLLDRIVERGPAWVAAYGSGRLSTVLGTGLEALRPWFSGYLPALVLGVLLPPLVVVIMAFVDPASAVIALFTLPLIPVLGALIGWATKARAEQRWAADARLAGHFLDVVRGLATLKMYGRAERQTGVIADLTDRHRTATLRVLRVAFLSSTALDLVGTLSVGLIAVQAGLRVAAGDMPLGPALLVILLAPEAFRPLREMAARYHASTDAGAVIADVDEILTAPTGPDPEILAVPTGPDPEILAVPAGQGPGTSDEVGTVRRSVRQIFGDARGRWGVRAVGLRARYPGVTDDAVRLDELTVHTGETVALRGVSGAGKTTTLRVLAGLHPAETGAVAVGRVFYLPQRPALPHARTAAEAFPPETTGEQVRSALRLTGLAEEITPETALGEQAAGISSGQRQRLALAVLLHRAGQALTQPGEHDSAPVVTLLLDEPTAHLDHSAEQLVIGRLREFAARGCAVLVVAHRPALLAAADRVVELRPPSAGIPIGGRVTATVRPDDELPSWSGTTETAWDGSRAPLPRPVPPRSFAVGASFQIGSADADPGTGKTRTNADAGPEARPKAGPGTGTEGSAGTGTAGSAGRWGWLRRPGTAAALGAGSSLAGILLTGAAAWLLVRASALPPVLSLSAAVVLVRGSAVARPLLRYLERLVAHDVAFARLGRRRAKVYADLIPHVPGPRLHRRGDLLTRLVDDVDARVDGLLRGRLPVASAVGTGVVCLTVVGWMAPAVAIPLAVGLLVAGMLAPAVAAWHADRQEAATGAARSALRDAMVETVDGVEELGGGGGRPGVPRQRSRNLANLEARAAKEAGLAAAIAHLGWAAAVAGVAIVLARGGLSAEWSAVLLLGTVVLGETIVGLPEAAVARRRAAGAEHRVTALTERRVTMPTANTTPAGSKAGPGDGRDGGPDDGPERGPDDGLRMGEVRVGGLVAGWNPDRDPVLDSLELRLAPGSRTAITGTSGCGKSTLAAVLSGLLTPRDGDVSAGGRTVLVGEDTGHVFASTVRENLRLAAPTATDPQLWQVLHRVGLDGLDLDTWLGTAGATISGGQRRRLATARALLADPAVLILDEPTEGIDEAGGRELMADLLGAADGRTVLVIAHRAEGLDLVGRILNLEAGKLRNVRMD
ncbi:thiol reductant ABC exporter subunit CydC [Actinoplanes derwentensis]|uniref:ATP-binding cassette, subfamily C, CydCD n=1 Tax=Actinoplanes derwentensis TaxID=113562 RepID=A0A1H1ZYM3_9ACTN|nr:thiol reductant ABC exporter subunit CydC [Actinoplanes derwentensis]GID83467.1 ABC transporter [Actinoplanes derwentensis]SDT38901.1 ATP-binding cassette, subfamily C, CydCD [Actinoplanes derwentensis]